MQLPTAVNVVRGKCQDTGLESQRKLFEKGLVSLGFIMYEQELKRGTEMEGQMASNCTCRGPNRNIF